MSLHQYRIDELAPSLQQLLLNGERLPAGNYDLSLKPSQHAEFFDVHLDGACLRAGLARAEALRCCALLRAALLVRWNGKTTRSEPT